MFNSEASRFDFLLIFLISWLLNEIENEDGDSKMAGQTTSFDVTGRHYQDKWYHLKMHTQGFLINLNLFPSAFTERKATQGSLIVLPVGVWYSFYLRGLSDHLLDDIAA